MCGEARNSPTRLKPGGSYTGRISRKGSHDTGRGVFLFFSSAEEKLFLVDEADGATVWGWLHSPVGGQLLCFFTPLLKLACFARLVAAVYAGLLPAVPSFAFLRIA